MKKCLLIFGMIVLLGLLSVWQHPFLLTQYAHFFSIHNATKRADALVVLSGGLLTRLPYAVELYQQGYAPLIILTDERARMVSPQLEHLIDSNTDSVEELLEDLEVQVKWTLIPSTKGGATSTFDEAYDLLQYSRQHPLKRIIIVTDAFHTRRSLYAFEKILENREIVIQAMGAPNLLFDETNWWQTDIGISMYVLEGIKYMVYRFTDQNVTFVKNY